MQTIRVRMIAVLAAIAVVISIPAAALAISPPAPPYAVPRAAPSATIAHLSGPRLVSLQKAPTPPAGSHPRVTRPFHPRNPSQYVLSKQQVDRAIAQAIRKPAPTSTQSPVGQIDAVQSQFPVISYDEQINQLCFFIFFCDQATTPPDTQLAAGPDSLVEMVNSSMSIWTKTGSLSAIGDLNSFFPVPLGYNFSDPRILYDASSQRWFASGLAFDGSFDSQTYVAVSTSSDPNQTWYTYVLANNQNTTLYDQPKIGVNDDKLVISWNDYGSGATVFTGAETWVLDKTSLVAGSPSGQAVVYGPDSSRFDIVPSQSLSSTASIGNAHYLVYNNADAANLVQNDSSGPTMGVVAITGNPTNGVYSDTNPVGVRWTEYHLRIKATDLPASAPQPGSATIETDDDRFLSAVWQNGTLWTTGNDGSATCSSQITSTRACLRLVQVNTADLGTAQNPVIQDFDAGVSGGAAYYPAVSMDANGSAVFAFTTSSATQYASAVFATQPVGITNEIGPVTTIINGVGVYNCSFCGGGPGRWGDYSAVAPDPSDASQVWVTGEYMASNSDGDDWGTGAAAVVVSLTGTATPTGTPSTTPTVTTSPTSTNTPAILTATNTPTVTATPKVTATPTLTVTATSTLTPTATHRGNGHKK